MVIVEFIDVKKAFSGCALSANRRLDTIQAVDGVSFRIEKGSTYGIVGESGSGKTTIGRLLLGIIKPGSGTVTTHSRNIQCIFQNPYSSLDPKMNIYDILAEGLLIRALPRSEISNRVHNVIDLVRLSEHTLKKYPHQFSGGERQRIAIARAVITQPDIIVCDEPVSGLDISIQVQVLDLLKEIQKQRNVSYLFITHDMRAVAYMADKIAVMKDGRFVEEGESVKIMNNSNNEYTRKLLSSVLTLSTVSS